MYILLALLQNEKYYKRAERERKNVRFFIVFFVVKLTLSLLQNIIFWLVV